MVTATAASVSRLSEAEALRTRVMSSAPWDRRGRRLPCRECHRAITKPGQQARRHLVPGSPVQDPSRALLVHAAPLLEEERYACDATLLLNLANPGRLHGTTPRAAFPSDDHPVNARQG